MEKRSRPARGSQTRWRNIAKLRISSFALRHFHPDRHHAAVFRELDPVCLAKTLLLLKTVWKFGSNDRLIQNGDELRRAGRHFQKDERICRCLAQPALEFLSDFGVVVLPAG